MNNEEAKLILSAYRPDGQDATDPRFVEALEQVRLEPELAAWFAQERRIDSALGGKIREQARPPVHLKAAILAAAAITRPAPWFRRPSWITAAAAAFAGALILLSSFIPKQGGNDFASFREEMTEILGSKQFQLDHLTPSASEAQAWLADQRVDFVLPAGLDGKPTMGCRVIEWHGHKVSLVCFGLDGGETAHLFTIDRSSLPNPPPEQAQFAVVDRWTAAGWTSGNKVYLLASSRGESGLRKVL